MARAGRVVVVGDLGRWLPGLAGLAQKWTAADVYVRSLDGVGTLVLLLDAIAALDPLRAIARLLPHVKRVVLCLGNWPSAYVDRLYEWKKAGFRSLAPREVEQQVLGERYGPPRPDVPRSIWLPRTPEAGSDAATAVDLLTKLARLGVRAWAEALGCDRRTLVNRCRQWFGTTPLKIVIAYKLALGAALRKQHATLEQCARVSQYAGASNLLKARRNAKKGARGTSSPGRRRRDRATSDERRATSDERRATSDERRATRNSRDQRFPK